MVTEPSDRPPGQPVHPVSDAGPPTSGRPVEAWTDAELAELAMAADPDAPIAPDAVPFSIGGVGPDEALLPAWYAPGGILPPSRGRRRRTAVVALIVGALIVVNGAGLCVTYGLPEIAW